MLVSSLTNEITSETCTWSSLTCTLCNQLAYQTLTFQAYTLPHLAHLHDLSTMAATEWVKCDEFMWSSKRQKNEVSAYLNYSEKLASQICNFYSLGFLLLVKGIRDLSVNKSSYTQETLVSGVVLGDSQATSAHDHCSTHLVI